MYLKSKNILSISREGKSLYISNEKSIINYIKDFFKKIIEFIKQCINKIMEFFNFKQKKQIVVIQQLKKEVASKNNIDVDVVETEKASSDKKENDSFAILKTVINHTYDKNTVNDIIEYCKYIFSRRVVNNISLDKLNNIGGALGNSSLNKIDKAIRKIGDFPFDSSKLVFCDAYNVFMYDYDVLNFNFEKIKSEDLNVDYENLNINVQVSDLKSDLNKLDNFCNGVLKEFTRTINADLSLLTTKLTKLEKELCQDLKGAGENISNDVNKKLKIIGNITRYSSNIVVDVNNTINFFIFGLINIIKKIVK